MPDEAPIRPVHSSIRARLARGERWKPRNMDRTPVPQELHEWSQKMALSIFTDATNVGVPFQEALAAVYVSGMNHGYFGGKKLSDQPEV